MSVIQESLSSIKAHLYEKVYSPLMGAFLVSWFLWNYQVIVVLFADLTPQSKFSLINQVYLDSLLCKVLFVFVIPLLSSYAIIYIYPLLAKKPFEYYREKQRELIELKQQIENKSLLTVEQSVELRLEIANLKDEFHKEISAKEEVIKGLRNKIENLNLTIKESKTATDLFYPKEDIRKIGAKAKELLELAARNMDGQIRLYVTDSGTTVETSESIIYHGEDNKQIQEWKEAISQLVLNYMIQGGGVGGEGVYVLTPAGYEYLENSKK